MNRIRHQAFEWGRALCVVLVIACQAGGNARAADKEPPLRPGAPSKTIFVASNGWHSAIFVPRNELTPDSLPEITAFPEARYPGFVWGDAEFFPARDPGFTTLLSAAFLPTPAVLHVTGLRVHPEAAYPKDEVIALKISHAGFRNLIAYLDGTFARADRRPGKPVAPGLDPHSYFYRAKGEFHLFNTCNSWTARGLAAAGVPIDADDIVRAEGLMASLRPLSANSFK